MEKLWFKDVKIGRRTKTKVTISYIKDIANTSNVKKIEKDLKKHKPESNFKVILNDDGELIGMLMAYISKMSIIEFRLKPLKLIIVDILDYFAFLFQNFQF